jgi:hypothetical protein
MTSTCLLSSSLCEPSTPEVLSSFLVFLFVPEMVASDELRLHLRSVFSAQPTDDTTQHRQSKKAARMKESTRPRPRVAHQAQATNLHPPISQYIPPLHKPHSEAQATQHKPAPMKGGTNPFPSIDPSVHRPRNTSQAAHTQHQ